MACKTVLSIELSVMLEMYYIYTVQFNSQQAHVAREHFKCEQCDGGVNFKYYLISTNVSLNSHTWLVAIWNGTVLRPLFIFKLRVNTYA